MALTPSTMLPLGTPLSQALLERERNRVSCHCPFVKHIEAEITRLQKDLGDRAVLLGIASNSLRTHPQDGPDRMAAQAALPTAGPSPTCWTATSPWPAPFRPPAGVRVPDRLDRLQHQMAFRRRAGVGPLRLWCAHASHPLTGLRLPPCRFPPSASALSWSS
jgi:hypothetical protein